ncbi:MAG: C40 family peptidase [Methylobacteriaceae bacterium]|nr:C40 family peptidase [Methylobacteriaceae bacterium]
MSASAPVTRFAIVAAARAFIGTPYRHQASLADAGCDCLGLVRGVWRALYGPEPEAVPPYTPDYGEADRSEPLLTLGHRHLVPIPIAVAQPGDILVFRMRSGRVAKHCAILSTPKTMIHAQSNDCVREVSLSAAWRRLIASAFAFPGVAD